eukprot:gene13858-18585_t
MFGLRNSDSVYLTSTSIFTPYEGQRGGTAMREDFDWIKVIGNNTLLALQGDMSDCEYLFQAISSANSLYELKHESRSMTVNEIANLCRFRISNNLRKQPLKVNILIAGWDEIVHQPKLYWLDQIGSLKNVAYAAHGIEFPFILSLLDSKYQDHLKPVQIQEVEMENNVGNEVKSSIQLLQYCWDTARKRTTTRLGRIRIKSINAAGIVDHGFYS